MIKVYHVDGDRGIIYAEYREFNFPGGEKHVKLNLPAVFIPDKSDLTVRYTFTNNESIITLLLLCDALKRDGFKLDLLIIDRVPFAQQDRVTARGEPLSIKVFCDLINNLGFNRVTIFDPHSDVTPALLNNCDVITQDQVFEKDCLFRGHFWFVCPDSGALKKIRKLASRVKNLGVIECSKSRDTETGELSKFHVNHDQVDPHDYQYDCIIVDDIAIRGGTFIGIAKELKRVGFTGKIILMVTHGLFVDGVAPFEGLIDEIYTKDGKVK